MSFWTTRRVTITGGAGFLGSFVATKLAEQGCRDVFVSRSKAYNLVEKDAVMRLYQDARPDIVIHLAAKVGGIGINQRCPGEFFYENLMMGAQMMEYGRLHGIEKFVAIGTICAYPKFAPVPFKEEQIWNGYPEETNAPYGLAKKMLLVQAQAYRAQYGFNAIYLLPTNLYGPGDNFHEDSSHVIPALIRKCVEARDRGEREIILWGDGSPTRSFLFVEDCAEAILLAAERYDESDPVNLGAVDHEISIKDLVTLIARQTGYDGTIRWDTSRPNGQPRRCVDTAKAEKLFGFRARTPFEQGLQRTISWYRSELSQRSI
jgi:GDP-L-fucose synthase